MTALAMVSMAGSGHVSDFTRKFVAVAFVVILVGGAIFVWWLKSEREDD